MNDFDKFRNLTVLFFLWFDSYGEAFETWTCLLDY